MDGYALLAAETKGASAERPARLSLAGRVAAGGVAEKALKPGDEYRIFTGAPLPDGADAVIPQEETQEDGGMVQVPRLVSPGQFVRPRGEDMRAGETVLERGCVLGPAEIGL